ncbi:MAG: PTS sugar transporter subunit IIB [Erysipelotrichaceae bacterium]|nr:PTS sugar transporter subunit IIB [Erysipelotrichaceae bacterium]
MSKIVAVRIDSRLIHGQTANLWHGHWNCDRYIVIDDETANDPTLKSVMRLACPQGIKLSVLTEEKAVQYLTEPNHYGNEKIVIIVKFLTALVKLVEAGVQLSDTIVVGTMVIGEDRTKVINTNVKVSDEDIKYFHQLADRGYNIIYQVVPTMGQEDFMPLLASVE